MGRMYTVVFNNVTVSAQQDFFEIAPAANKPVVVHGLFLSSQDAVNENLSIAVKTGQTTSGSGGTAPTPAPIGASDTAAGFAAEVNNTTKASTGTILTKHVDNVNINANYALWWTPETRIRIPGGGRGTVELTKTPAAARTMSGTLYVEEED